MAISPDGTTAVTGSDDKTARVWDLRTGETVRVLEGHGGERGGHLAGRDDGGDGVGRHDGARVGPAHGRDGEGVGGAHRHVRAVAISPDGTTAVTGSDDNTARVWDLRTGETVRVLEGHTTRC